MNWCENTAIGTSELTPGGPDLFINDILIEIHLIFF